MEETMNGNKGVQRLRISIMILALTVLACQGASRLNPFVTATPTPTVTFTPTITPSPTPSPTPTYTPTATPLPTGRVKEVQPDGSTLFTDYDGKYQVTFPEDWTVVIFDKDDITRILNNLPEQEKNVSELIESLKKTDVNNLIRVVGYNFKVRQNVYTPIINIVYDTNPISTALSLDGLIDVTASYLPSLNAKLINSEVKETSSGIKIGTIESQWTLKASGGQKINLLQKQVFFKSGEGVVYITFGTLKDAKVDLKPDLEKLIESIQLLGE